MENNFMKSLPVDLRDDWKKMFESAGLATAEEVDAFTKDGSHDVNSLVRVSKEVNRNGKKVEKELWVTREEAGISERTVGRGTERLDVEIVSEINKSVTSEKHNELKQVVSSWGNKQAENSINELKHNSLISIVKSEKGDIVGFSVFEEGSSGIVVKSIESSREVRGVLSKAIEGVVQYADSNKSRVFTQAPDGKSWKKALGSLGFEIWKDNILKRDPK